MRLQDKTITIELCDDFVKATSNAKSATELKELYEQLGRIMNTEPPDIDQIAKAFQDEACKKIDQIMLIGTLESYTLEEAKTVKADLERLWTREYMGN